MTISSSIISLDIDLGSMALPFFTLRFMMIGNRLIVMKILSNILDKFNYLAEVIH